MILHAHLSKLWYSVFLVVILDNVKFQTVYFIKLVNNFIFSESLGLQEDFTKAKNTWKQVLLKEA